MPEPVFRTRRSPGRHRRRPGRTLLALAASALLAASGCTTPLVADATVLKLADNYAPTHMFAEYGVLGFIEEIQEAADEPISVEYYPSGQMGGPREVLSLNRAGSLDITPAAPAYLADQLPLSSVTDLPGLFENSCVAARSLQELLSPGGILYEEEYEPRGLRPLWVAVLPGYEIMTVGRPVEQPADLRGLTIRSSGGAMDGNIAALGAAPVSMPASDAYEALSRRTVDGVSFPPASVLPYRLQEVLAYSTEGLNAGAFAIPYVMSESTWESLTQVQQQRVQEAAQRANERLCEGIEHEGPAAREVMAEDGVEFVRFDEQQAEEFAEMLQPVRERWASELDRVGKPGSAVLQEFERALQTHERDADQEEGTA
ncbi:TRAP transporter substrate-binding protein DctP [Sediminivirga luteola]|uniref:C4-dicarboxylate ABC transporter n=1 Tax=Sediminivirga luteola TaxID=1774748 RepID=A0A8J2TVJ4_9MICO|nr:TRAP transporter substrate-binding protein DctP [Sediminivirga luteola]MCI2265894.1 TRAP transporter substrate-binding protein DctP [Sediminivirga luteola]GGA03987.1 C4-dicarboxylate ABC transporter [Sediminivirga luteola]